jgi:Fur family zinc uptake transcriptional regulator
MTAGGFSAATEASLDRADRICARRGVRLTDIRRDVLGLILEAGGPAGAYDLLDRLKATRKRAAPPTVYRARDFLLEHGLVHKLERLSAFVGCVAHEHDAHGAQFLICRTCNRVTELEDHEVAHALAEAAERAGFSLGRATIEAEGVCALCREAAAA